MSSWRGSIASFNSSRLLKWRQQAEREDESSLDDILSSCSKRRSFQPMEPTRADGFALLLNRRTARC